MAQARKTAARKPTPKPSASGASGGPALGAGFIYQVNFAVCKLLQLCAEFLSFPLRDPTIQIEVRAIGGDAGATRWDLGLEAAGQLIETKLHPAKQDLSEWLRRTLSQFRDGADLRQSVFVFGRTSGRRLVSLKHLIRNANEAGADETKFRALVEVEDVAEAPSLLQELGERPREMLQRMKLVDLSEGSLSDEIDLYCRLMAGPERGEDLRDLLYRRVSEAVPHRATIHVRELVQVAADRGIHLAPIPNISLQGLAPEIRDALLLLSVCPASMPDGVLANAVGVPVETLNSGAVVLRYPRFAYRPKREMAHAAIPRAATEGQLSIMRERATSAIRIHSQPSV